MPGRVEIICIDDAILISCDLRLKSFPEATKMFMAIFSQVLMEKKKKKNKCRSKFEVCFLSKHHE